MGILGIIRLPLKAGKLILVGRDSRARDRRHKRVNPLPVAGLSPDEHWDVLVRLQRLATTTEVC